MRRKPKYLKRPNLLPILLAVGGIVLVILVVILLSAVLGKGKKPKETAPTETTVQTQPTTEATTLPTETTEPPVTEPQILPQYAQMAEKNADMVGWIRIDGTRVDYPLMYAPDDYGKYLHKDINEFYSIGGLPFIDENCSWDPNSANLLIYGHNMSNGSMFHDITSYEKRAFWKEHPYIQVDTLYEEKTYEVVAAFYDQIYRESDTCFKFYHFIDPQTKEEFDTGIKYFKHKGLYDTGITPQYGDKLVTLVTCIYHVDNGRFIVVAREVPNEP